MRHNLSKNDRVVEIWFEEVQNGFSRKDFCRETSWEAQKYWSNPYIGVLFILDSTSIGEKVMKEP